MRALRDVDVTVRPRIEGAIALLAEDPRPPASRPLRGRPGYRVRVSDYRVLYRVQDDVLLIVVVTLGHREMCTAKTMSAGASFSSACKLCSSLNGVAQSRGALVPCTLG